MMNKKRALIAVAVTTAVLALPSLSVIAQQDDDEPPEMGFFVTSTTTVSYTHLTLPTKA